MIIKLIIIGLFAAMIIGIGVYSNRKANSLTAFVVGSRNAGPWVSAFTYGATYFSAVLFIGYAGRSGYDFGGHAIWIGVGNAIVGTLLAWVFLAERTRDITARHNIKTMPEFFRKRFDSPFMKTYSAIIIFIFLVPYSASVYSGIAYFSETVLGIDYTVCMLIIAVLTAIYLVAGGYMATMWADLVQGAIMIGGVIVMLWRITTIDAFGNLAGAIQKVGEVTSQTVHVFDFSQPNNILALVGMILLTSFGTWGLPQTVSKFYAIKSKAAIKSGTIISTLFAMLISCGAYFSGSVAKAYFGSNPPMANGQILYDTIIPQFLAANLNNFLLAIIFVLVLSASMSTLSSIVLTSSSSFTINIVKDVFKPDMSDKKTLFLTRGVCFLLVIASFVIASFKSPILTLMSFSWGATAGSFLGPYVVGLFYKGMTKAGAISGMVGGTAISLILMIGSNFKASQAPLFGAIAMLTGVVLCIVVSLFTKKFSNEHVAQFFQSKAVKKANNATVE